MDVLFISHRIPFPPDKGDKIRSFQQVRHLAETHRVRVVCAADDPDDVRHAAALREVVDDVVVLPFGRMGALARTACALPSTRPLSLGYFPSTALTRAARDLVGDRRPDVVLAFSAQAAPAAFAIGAPVVLDLVDRDSVKWAQYARWFRRGVRERFRGLVYRIEAGRLARAEEAWIRRAARTLIVSDYERTLFPEALQPRIDVVRPTVDLDGLRPDRSAEDAATILFAGALDYFPNEDAVCWFAREVMPRVRAERPDARFRVVGPRAPAAVRALAELPGVDVAGYVDDIHDEYRKATLDVAPFRVTQGVLNKVLEAMASGIAVVATPEAVRGIGAEEGEGVRLGRDPESLATAVTALLADRDARHALGRAGRAFVTDGYGYPGDLTAFERIVRDVAGGGV